MEIAKVIVSGVRADVKDLKPITSGMVGATVSFTFEDPLWNELTKTVVYKTRHGVRDDLEIGEDGVSKIPPELLLCYGLELKVGVYGINDAGDLVIPTVWASLDFIKAGADPSGDPGTDPSLPPWHKLRQDVDKMAQQVQEVADLAAIQPDLAQNDPTQPDYVQNRTHWTESGLVEILPETALVYDEDENSFLLNGDGIALTVGEEYTITWNGTNYICIAQDISSLMELEGAVALGACALMWGEAVEGLTGTEEPFVMIVVPPAAAAGVGVAAMAIALDGSTEATVSIKENGEVVHKLDSKYLPDLPSTIPVIPTAEVDQAVVVKAVDGNGKPMEWEAADQLFGELRSNTIKWDGNKDGKVTVVVNESLGWYLVKVSDATPTIDDFANGYVNTIINPATQEIRTTHTHTSKDATTPGAGVIALKTYGSVGAYIVDDAGVGVYVTGKKFPEKGTYLQLNLTSNDAVGSLTIPGYAGYSKVKKIDEKFLPDTVGKVKTVNGIAPDENGNVVVEIPEASGGGIPIPETAEVGQTIVVKAVDDNGKPTEWECTGIPTDDHINSLIDAKLGVIENGTY